MKYICNLWFTCEATWDCGHRQGHDENPGCSERPARCIYESPDRICRQYTLEDAMKRVLRQPNGTKFADYAGRDELITILRKWAEVHPEISKVVVYGSRARGEHRPDSDFDVAVELTRVSDEDPFVIWLHEQDNWRNELSPLLLWRLHLEWHDLEGTTPVVRNKIARGHLVVFAREP